MSSIAETSNITEIPNHNTQNKANSDIARQYLDSIETTKKRKFKMPTTNHYHQMIMTLLAEDKAANSNKAKHANNTQTNYNAICAGHLEAWEINNSDNNNSVVFNKE